MAFYFNENIPENIYYNDNEVLIVKYNDDVVWQKQSPTPPTPSDYAHQYLTFKALSNGTFDYYSDNGAEMSYSLDSGSTWSQPSSSITFNVQSGDVVMWCGDNTSGNVGTFRYGTAPFDVEGNIMSLIYGENIDFDNDTEFSGGTGQFYETFGHPFDGEAQVVHAHNLILPSTALTSECYRDMFRECDGLITAPSLPATTLANGCYRDMFNGCINLTTAPELPATTLVTNCYQSMFASCSSLNYIKMLATDISASSCLYNWVQGVANSGTFVKNASMTTLPTGNNGIPSGWTVQDDVPPAHDYSQDYFTIVAKDDGDITLYVLTYQDSNDDEQLFDIQISTDNGSNWASVESYNDDGVWAANISVNSGDTILMKCDIPSVINENMGGGSILQIPYSPAIDVQGNIMSLIYGDNFTGQTSMLVGQYDTPFTFEGMFGDNGDLHNAENLILPATTLVEGCYYEMFRNCTSLTTAPELPATTLAEQCYWNMFVGCTSLTTAPELLATTLNGGCYMTMFYGCTSLNYIKMLGSELPEDVSYEDCLTDWVSNVSATGTFVKATNATLSTGDSGIPSGWTVQNV